MQKLITLAEKYETAYFLNGDPSWFMHQVTGVYNQEVMAFIASCLSYGSRKQFMPKIQFILDASKGNVYEWVRNGDFHEDIPNNPNIPFYRLYTQQTMNNFLVALQGLLNTHNSLGNYVKINASDGFSAVDSLCRYFSKYPLTGVVPKNTTSACKRLCMFLRWMVRDKSPVDLGIWSNFIDKKTLIIPLDTHVLQEARHLKLIEGRTSSMSTARQLTERLLQIFPEDPLKGDFALFGYGVNKNL